jgi:acyl-CoA reductase-like NAD-dependent aldehyde dehydrogenase
MAQRVSAQNGLPISIATMLEGGFPVIVVRYIAGLLEGASFEEERPGFLGGTNIVRREPIGVVGAIVPWNYPQTLAAFKYAPALAAVCTIVMKPSPETVLDAFLLAEAVAAAGIPEGVVSIVPGGRKLGAYLVEHRDVDKVAFTGSTAAGRRVAEACGRLLRPVTLELGGKSAAIVLDDADLDLAKIGNDLFAATLVNNGQTCYLGTRVLAPRSRYDEVVDTMAAFASSLAVGNALDPATQIGPMASQTHRDRVEGYVAKGNSDGARLVVGGGRPRDLDRGWFVEPTVFADVDNSSTIAQEEIFGPVLSVIAYGDVDDAIRIANDSDFGLAGRCGPPTPSAARTSRGGSGPAPSGSTSTCPIPARRSAESRPAASAANSARTRSAPTSSSSRSTPDPPSRAQRPAFRVRCRATRPTQSPAPMPVLTSCH